MHKQHFCLATMKFKLTTILTVVAASLTSHVYAAPAVTGDAAPAGKSIVCPQTIDRCSKCYHDTVCANTKAVGLVARSNSGGMTHYDPSIGLGSCGWVLGAGEAVVSMSGVDMANPANPNNNPKCGKFIKIYGPNGLVVRAKIVDTCYPCHKGDIDVTPAVFNQIAPNGDGRVHGVSWEFE